jgi:tRNA(Ile)-lysidine synthase
VNLILFMQVRAVFEDKLSKFIADNQLFTATDKLLLAVSGGIDSMVMSEALFNLGYTIAIAHVNHCLRDDESDEDEKFVRHWAEINGIDYFIKQFKTRQIAAAKKKGIQETARKLRYEWFKELRQQHGFTHILTAHHLGDALETSLYQLIKGCGINGVRGIPLRQGAVVRPMLSFSREEIVQYAHASHLQWREDSSNASNYYARNFIRHQIIPLLQQINPSVVHSFADTHQRLSDAIGWLQSVLADAEKRIVHESGGTFYLTIKDLEQLPSPRLFLYEYLKKSGFNYKTATLIAQHLRGQSGKRFLSATHEVIINREQLIVSPLTTATPPLSVKIEDFGDYTIDNQIVISIRLVKAADVYTNDRYTVRINPAALQFPLHIRQWQPGDYMQPLGMRGRKKISDILTDLKVPTQEKKSACVLCTADGQILWLIGYRLAEAGRVTAPTEPMAELAIITQAS